MSAKRRDATQNVCIVLKSQTLAKLRTNVRQLSMHMLRHNTNRGRLQNIVGLLNMIDGELENGKISKVCCIVDVESKHALII